MTNNIKNTRLLEIKEGDEGVRLDRWLRRQIPGLAQGLIEKLVRTGQIRINGARVKAGHRLELAQLVRIPPIPNQSLTRKSNLSIINDDDLIELRERVLYRDNNVLVINKPPGLAVQGGSSITRHLDAMLDALRFDLPENPRLVHRLDKHTSGVLVLARTSASAAFLTKLFRNRSIRKVYWALTVGIPPLTEGVLKLPLAKVSDIRGYERVRFSEEGQVAITKYTLISSIGRKASWLALEPETGRTHQLRAHMEALGTPIVGDKKYKKSKWPEVGGLSPGLHLHARMIEFSSPSGAKIMVEAPLPDHMQKTWSQLGLELNLYNDFINQRRAPD